MLADPAFREAAAPPRTSISAEVELEQPRRRLLARVDQVQPTEDLPSFASNFAGDTTRAIQREEWADPTGGTLRIEAPGKPSRSRARSPCAGGRRHVEIVELEIKVKVPLIGGKLEKLLAEKVRAGMDAEHGVGVAWLEGEH